MKAITSLCMSLLLATAFLGHAKPLPHKTYSVTLGWDEVQDPRVQEIRIYYGAQSHVYAGFFAVAPSETQAVMANLNPQQEYFFAAAAHNDIEGDGQLSNEVQWPVPHPNQTPLAAVELHN